MAEDTVENAGVETDVASTEEPVQAKETNVDTTKKVATVGSAPVAIAKAQKVAPFKKAVPGAAIPKKPVAAGSSAKAPAPAQAPAVRMPSGKPPKSPFATSLLVMTLILVVMSVFILYLNTATDSSMAGVRGMINNLAQGSDNALSMWPEQNDLVAQEVKTLIEQSKGTLDSAEKAKSATEKLLTGAE